MHRIPADALSTPSNWLLRFYLQKRELLATFVCADKELVEAQVSAQQ